MELVRLGWADPFKTAFENLADSSLVPARVLSSQRERVKLLTECGVLDAALSGAFRHHARAGDLPVVGDWVAARVEQGAARASVAALLARRGALVRKRPDGTADAQLLAANVDVVFVVSSLNRDFSPRRIERALALIWEAAAQPVVLLTKLDECEDAERFVAEARAVALGVPVHALSVISGQGLDALRGYSMPGRTLALIGSSGVGKSTLVNWFMGETRAAISAVRADDDKGRHTTTARELFVLPDGGLLIDTPGMRELGLWDASAGFETAFDDIQALAAACRFTDCTHDSEPGCALRAAIDTGNLDPSRYAAYGKLQRELAHEARRRDESSRLEHQRSLRRMLRQHARAQRNHPKR